MFLPRPLKLTSAFKSHAIKFGLILTCALACLSVCATAKAAIPAFSPFQTARPVWPEGKETERNLLVEVRAAFERPDDQLVTVRLAASTLRPCDAY